MFEPISREAVALREQLEKTAISLKQDWIDGLAHVERLKKQSRLLQRAEAGRQEILRELGASTAGGGEAQASVLSGCGTSSLPR